MTWLEPDDGDCPSPHDRQAMRDYTRRTGMEAWFAERRGERHWAWTVWDGARKRDERGAA